MKLIKNWRKMYKSLAVIFPTVAAIILVIIDAAMQTNAIPIAYVPIVIAASSFLGRIVKQKNLGVNHGKATDYKYR